MNGKFCLLHKTFIVEVVLKINNLKQECAQACIPKG
jgi:hypothetical protein